MGMKRRSRRTEALPESDIPDTDPARRKRYARSASQAACVSLTPVRLEILRHLAELRFLSLPQIARLCCPSGRQDLSEKSARRYMRALFDGGLVDVLPVSRAALAPPGAPNDASLLYGSAPNVYAPSAWGLETLWRAGLTDRPEAGRKKAAYGPKNSLFLAHELAVRDVRVWLETVTRAGGHGLERWKDGEAAAISLDRERTPYQVRPDAWFALRLGKAVLVGLAEVDRGTERGDRRWREKVEAYHSLFSDRARLSAATGYVNARVLVFTTDHKRRDALACSIQKSAGELRLPPALLDRFWLVGPEALVHPDLTGHRWRRPGSDALRPLVSSEALECHRELADR